MSVKVISMVFDRYPEGGNEMVLALAIADHAWDDGTHIYPAIDALAVKSRQSRRTVQRLIAGMVERGWLELVSAATGRRGMTNEYRINAGWIAGEPLRPRGVKLTPHGEAEKVIPPQENVMHTGVNLTPHEEGSRGVTGDAWGVTTGLRGVTAVAPKPSEPSATNTPLPPDGGAAGFEEAFAEFPNHANRAKAERRWRRLAPDLGLQKAIRSAIAAQRCTAKWSKDDGRFVPEFHTWLRNACWRDGAATRGGAWDANRRTIEAKAAELGIEPWNEADLSVDRETFGAYTARVREAVESEVACAH